MKTSKLPVQSVPVERQMTGAAISCENGVEASGVWDVLKTVAAGAWKGIISSLR